MTVVLSPGLPSLPGAPVAPGAPGAPAGPGTGTATGTATDDGGVVTTVAGGDTTTARSQPASVKEMAAAVKAKIDEAVFIRDPLGFLEFSAPHRR